MPWNPFKRSPKNEESELVADDSDQVVMSGGSTTVSDSTDVINPGVAAGAPGPIPYPNALESADFEAPGSTLLKGDSGSSDSLLSSDQETTDIEADEDADSVTEL